MAFLDLVGQLCGEMPGLSPILAQKHLNQALGDIYNERLWSFNELDAAIVCPAIITAGTASITQFSDSVTLDATASAAVLAQTAPTAVPGLLTLSIRFGATSPAASQIYNIVAFDITVPAAIVLTLNRVVMETTNAASSLQIYRPYIIPPITDFLKWETLVDMNNAITIRGNRLTMTSAFFDARDPQRTSLGLAYYCGSYAGGYIADPTTGIVTPQNTVSAGAPIYELWPHPSQGQTFYCRFKRKGALFVQPGDTQPDGISDAMIIAKAKADFSYPFAAANVANFPTFKGANWTMLIGEKKKDYQQDLLQAKRIDDERALQTIFCYGHGLRVPRHYFKGDGEYPIDANYLQSHLVRF